MAQQIQVRRDTAANWTSADPILAQGEMGFEVDTNKGKFGDGTTAWTSLPYFGGSSLGTVTSVAALTLGTTGTDLSSSVANPTTTPVITLNVPTASAANRGALSSADWSTFNSKADTASPTFTGTLTTPAIVVSSETATTIASFDASKNIKSLSTGTYPSLTELAYVKGLTSSVQTQLNSKENTSNKATDFSTVNDTLYPTVQAAKTYADNLVAGLLDYRGAHDASSNLFPSTGGSGTAGAIAKGDMFIISVAGTLGGTAVQIGDSLIASIDTPGQTASNWNILNSNITYVPEDVANKATSVTGNESSDTKYASVKSIYDWATGLFAPQTRTLTINGVAQDLSANRSWTVAVPTLTSELTNDSGFITSSALASYLPKAGDTYTTTTGNGLALTTSTLTTGSLVSLSSTGTGAGSNTQTVLNIATSGANGTSTQTTYGTYVTNTHTGTASTNVAGYFSASGGTNNYGLIVANGNVGIGTTAPPTNPKLAVVSGPITGSGASDSTIQLRHATENVGHSTAIEFTFGNGNNSYCGSRIVGETASAGGGNLHFQTGSSSLGTYSTKMYIAKAGNVGIGTTSPTAMLHIKAGTASANTAPLKFTTGTNLTTAEAGAVEYDGTELYFTPSTTRYKLGQVTAGSSTIASGTYTPTLTGVTNVTSTTAYVCQYMRVGNVVTVSGKIEVTPTVNNAQTTIGVSLPIASNFANSQECGGAAHSVANTVLGHGAAIYADATNDRAEMDYFETHGASDTFSFSFTYQII